jgi:hypothetical protein
MPIGLQPTRASNIWLLIAACVLLASVWIDWLIPDTPGGSVRNPLSAGGLSVFFYSLSLMRSDNRYVTLGQIEAASGVRMKVRGLIGVGMALIPVELGLFVWLMVMADSPETTSPLTFVLVTLGIVAIHATTFVMGNLAWARLAPYLPNKRPGQATA